MIDRGTLLRAFFALFVCAAVGALVYGLFSDVDGESGNFADPKTSYGPIFEDPAAYRRALLADRWVQRIPVTGTTFGRAIERQVRISMDGVGPLPGREVTLETPPAIQMFASGEQRTRAEQLVHGMQEVLEQRGGLVRGVSLTESRGGYEAAAIAGIVEQQLVDGVISRSEQRIISRLLREYGEELTSHALAWYDGRTQWIVLGPAISKRLLAYVRAPESLTAAEGIFAAYVVRHELEHAVTPRGGDAGRAQWIEESVADTLARWPGEAASTAKALGLPYPKRYEEIEYVTKRGGYPPYVTTMRTLLAAAGVDWRDPKNLDEATELLQAQDARGVAGVLAVRLAKRHRLTDRQRDRLDDLIVQLDGSPRAARRLVAGIT